MAETLNLQSAAQLLAGAADPLEAILSSSHPLMVEAFYLAAIPQWYDAEMLRALRARDDGREDGLVERLARYSFISPLPGGEQEHPAYYVRPQERVALQRRWIAEDAAAFQAAQARALAFWQEHPDANVFAQAQCRLYHLLFVDFQQGIQYLLDRFRAYRNEHHLAAVERLLSAARQAQVLLVLLHHELAATFDDLLVYLEARLAQLRGDWDAAGAALERLSARFDGLEPSLRPYVLRAQAYSLGHEGHQAQAIDCLKQALKEFDRPEVRASTWGLIEAERGYTLLALGDAYVNLAVLAGGQGQREPVQAGLWSRLRPVLYFLASLPLVIYLSLYLGRRVWQPSFWPGLAGLDWIIARLMASGARYYRRADRILERYGQPAEGLIADEKLAFLLLRLGDARGSERLCSWLLSQAEAPLGPYRQASVWLLWGEAHLRLRQPVQALEPLRTALPILASYGDEYGGARARELLGEALLATGQQDEALTHLAAARRSFQAGEHWVEATRLAEQIEAWLRAGAIGAAGREQAEQIARDQRRRQYPGSYRHPLLLRFRQLVLATLPLALILIPLLTITLDTSSALSPEMHFRPVPVVTLGNDQRPLLTPALNQGIKAANVAKAIVSGTLLQATAAFTLTYLLASLLLGLAAIVFTPVQSVEARGRGATVFLDEEGLALGDEGARRPGDGQTGSPRRGLPWQELSAFVGADTYLLRRPLEDRSGFALVAGSQRLIVGGSTAWYSALRARVGRLLPAKASSTRVDYGIFPSRLGWLYLLNMALLVGLGLLAASSNETMAIRDLPGTSYSIVDLYPYLFLGLVLPPLWWGVFQPLRQRAYLRPRSRVPLLVLGAGLLLLAVQVLLRFRPLLTVLDLYLPLSTVAVLLSAEWALWRARVDSRPVFPTALRLGTAAVVLLACLFLSLVIIRDTRAYHALVQGNTLRDRAQSSTDPDERRALLDTAIGAYRRAAGIGSSAVWGLDTRPAAFVHFGLPSPRRFTWLAALQSEAALQVEAGLYPEAIANLTETLRYADRSETAYASRALARLSLGTRTSEQGGVEIDAAQYQQAVSDLQKAIELNRSHAAYNLWLGLAYQSLSQASLVPGEQTAGEGDLLSQATAYYRQALAQPGPEALKAADRERALTGLGWIAYARDQYDTALSWFEQATEAAPEAYEAWLGRGYALYSLDRFEEALPVWELAATLEPHDPIAYFSLGALHWKLGGQAGDSSSPEACSEYTQSSDYFERGAEGEGLWPQPAADQALTYRAVAQLDYLLGNCADYDKVTAYEMAVMQYSRAIEFDPQAPYWWRQGRLSYAIASLEHKGSPAEARDWLRQAIDQVGQAIQVAPKQPIYLHDQSWMLYLAWDWAPVKGLAEQEGLLRARANLQAALALDARDRGTGYRPNFWLPIVEPLAVTGTLTLGDERLAAGDYAGALACYELLNTYLPDSAPAAFGAGLASLGTGDGQAALTWYSTGLERAAGNRNNAEEALLALYLALQANKNLPAGPILALFQARGIEPTAHDPARAFQLSLMALGAGDPAQYVRLSNLGLELAVAAGDIAAVRSGAEALRDYLLAHPEADVTGVYWPLDDNLTAREQAVAALARPDLYWRYRAEFGFRLVADRQLMLARPGNDRPYEQVMKVVVADIERAYALNPDEHRVWRDFFVDDNIGWIYLRRGDDYVDRGDDQQAVADYELATLRIEPNSQNAALDLTEALFKAGLTALRLGQVDRGQRLYNRGLDLLQLQGAQFGLSRKVPEAITALQDLQAQEPALAGVIPPIVAELEPWR